MTVPSEQSSIQYDADGVSVSFPVPFRFIQDQHLRVTLLHAGVETVLVLGADYSVSGANDPAGGSVTTTVAYPLGDSLAIERIVPITQETAYQRNDPFPERAHEQALDKLTMICQQIAGWLGWGISSLSRVLMLGRLDTPGLGAYRAGGNRIQDLGDPLADQDAVNRRSMRNYVELMIAGVVGGFGFFIQSGVGAIVRTFQSKQREWVSVEDFRQPLDPDDTAAFIRACSLGCTVIAAGDVYTLVGEVPLAAGTHLQFTRNPLVNFDISGENGRGFWFPPGTENASVTGSARIDATVTTPGSDGARNGVFSMCSDFYVDDPAPIRKCQVNGLFDVRMLGPANGKALQIYGYVEDVACKGITATGQTNFAFAAHWVGNGTVGVAPTKTWHPHRLKFVDCVAEHDGDIGTLARAFTTSACGHVVFDNCHAIDAKTLGFNIFVGDYGFTYAQNISPLEAFAATIDACTYTGTAPALSVDAISSRLHGSPLWVGAEHNASLNISGLSANMRDGTSGLVLAIAGLKTLDARTVRVVEETDSNSSQTIYLTSISKVSMQGEITSQGGILVRDCGDVSLDVASEQVTETPDITSYAIAASALSNTTTTAASVSVGATSVTIANATSVMGPGGYLLYDDGTTVHEIELRSMTYAGDEQTLKITPSPVSIPSGATVTLVQTVRRMQIGDVRLSGARFLLRALGSATAKPRNVSCVGTTFRRSGVADVSATAADGLILTGCSFDEGGQTSSPTPNPASVLLGDAVEGFAVSGNRFGRKNTRVRYLVQCSAGTKNGTISGNTFESVDQSSINPAAIFKGTAQNVVIGDNATSPGITPVYP